jgi:exo-1,4-beta-D-glucosaminidase
MKSIIAVGLTACWLAPTALAATEPGINPQPRRMERTGGEPKPACLIPSQGETRNQLDLRENWFLQSSCKVSVPAEILSTSQFSPDHWYKATVPSTVLAAQVADGEFKDIYFGDNLRKLPGMDHSASEPGGNPYACSWWYRTEFQLPPDFKGRRVWLHFNGINSKANVWLNGRRLADANDVAGAHRIFEFEATPLLDQERKNVLAVEVFAPTDKDFGINLVDWCPTPPDRDMGIWRKVYLTASGPVRVRYPVVMTHFPGDPLSRADLTVRTELHNDTDSSVEGMLRGGFETVTFEKKVTLSPRETRSVTFTPDEFPQLKIDRPELWWPAGLGTQKLHSLSMEFESSGAVSDSQTASFGIREIRGELHGASPRMGELYDNNGDFSRIKTDKRPLLIRVNRQPVLIRGAGWSPEMLLRTSRDRLRAELCYVRDMHLNAIRLEGKLEGDDFFDLADEMGILILAGWCCGDRWEHWSTWEPNDYTIATDSLRTQILRLRHHACLALWMNGSDNPPPPPVEEVYRKILVETGWPNPVVSSASSEPTSVSGTSGVKMTGPYDYVPPGYWLIDTDHFGGAFGFNTETSPGAAIPVMSSLKKFLPKEHLWPIDSFWNLHTGAGNLNGDLKHFNASMNAIYGPPKGLDDYIAKSQAMAYDGERAMFEAYGRNKYESTGVIQWMLNNGWPSMIWHLYDFYLQPAAGYFGTKKACEPLHIQYSYDDRSVVVVNSVNRDFSELTAEASMYDFNLRRLFFRKICMASPADSVRRLFDIPDENIDTEVHFVRLTLSDKNGRVLSTNLYWLPKKLSTYDWSLEQAREHPYYTAVTSYEDLSMLNQLQKVHLDASAVARRQPEGEDVCVQMHNPSRNLAFQIRLSVVDEKNGEEILPVLWGDNYFSLMPGESRSVVARYESVADAGRLGWKWMGGILTRRSLPSRKPARTSASILVNDKWIKRMSRLDDDIVPVHLRKGRNRILIKIQNMVGE